MPRSEPKVPNRRVQPPKAREHLACGHSYDSWETALIMARSSVRDAIWHLCEDPASRAQSHTQIYTTVEEYVRSLIRVEKRKTGAQITFRREFLDHPLAGVEALKRLGRPNALQALAKAWTELPSVALDALSDACAELRGEPLSSAVARWPVVPGTFVQLNKEELAQLLPLAIIKARSYGNRSPIRDHAIITVLGEYARLFGSWPSAKEASRFIESIENCYRELLPTYGFGVGSDGAIYRFLGRARATF